MSKISVIVPIYNSEKYLARCLNSIINQSFEDIEIICINDGSTDKSLNILESFLEIENRLVLVNQENKGVAKSRNIGIKLAKSDIIAFVDSDDTIERDMFKNMLLYMEKYNSCMVLTNFNYLTSEGMIYRKFSLFKEILEKDEIFKKMLSMEFPPSPCIAIYKKKLFIDNQVFYPDGKYFEDPMTAFRLVYYAKNISINESHMYNYYDIKNSITTTFSRKKFKDMFYNFYMTKKFLIQQNLFLDYNSEYESKIQKSINFLLDKIKNNILNEKERLEYLKYLWQEINNYRDIKKIHFSKIMIWIFLSLQLVKNNENYIKKLLSSFKCDNNIVQKISLLLDKKLGLSQLIIDYLKNNNVKQIYIYGMGILGQKILLEIENMGIHVLGIIDKNVDEINLNLEYKTYNSLSNLKVKNNTIIIVTSESFAFEITCEIENTISKNLEVINFYKFL